MSGFRRVVSGVLVLWMVWIGAGCAPKIVPKIPQSGQIDLESNIITKEAKGVRVSVQTQEWAFAPYDLESYFTPFLFLIKNDTDGKIGVKGSEIVLFDEEGNQYNGIPPEGVEMVMATRDLYGRGPYPSVFFRYEESRPPYTLGFEFPAYLRRPFSNVSLLSLPDGEIHPKSQIRGFVYFRKATTYGKTLRLKVPVDGFEEEFEFEVRK